MDSNPEPAGPLCGPAGTAMPAQRSRLGHRAAALQEDEYTTVKRHARFHRARVWRGSPRPHRSAPDAESAMRRGADRRLSSRPGEQQGLPRRPRSMGAFLPPRARRPRSRRGGDRDSGPVPLHRRTSGRSEPLRPRERGVPVTWTDERLGHAPTRADPVSNHCSSSWRRENTGAQVRAFARGRFTAAAAHGEAGGGMSTAQEAASRSFPVCAELRFAVTSACTAAPRNQIRHAIASRCPLNAVSLARCGLTSDGTESGRRIPEVSFHRAPPAGRSRRRGDPDTQMRLLRCSTVSRGSPSSGGWGEGRWGPPGKTAWWWGSGCE